MSESDGHGREGVIASALDTAQAALSAGKAAVQGATHAARTGAALAVGAVVAGSSILLDLGVRTARSLNAPNTDEDAQLETTAGSTLGWWIEDGSTAQAGEAALSSTLHELDKTLFAIDLGGRIGWTTSGHGIIGDATPRGAKLHRLRAMVPPVRPESLGDSSFRGDYGLRYAYCAGAMANGIGSEAIVESMAKSGMLGFFGAAGLTPARVEQAIDRIQSAVGGKPYGFNLIHSPAEPALENAIVDLYLRRGVRLVDASAYLDLTLPLVRFRVAGLSRGPDGRVICANKVIGKVSRTEVARKFFAPAPEAMLAALVKSGGITEEQAKLAARVPIAHDITAEADSGGHTDNRPALTLIPTMLALRDEMMKTHGYDRPLRVGAAGGIGTPASAAAAFAMGAAYVMTGSINQACVEAGTSATVREMLAHAGQADVAMAAAADMFEMGVKVQVLKWGTMFAVRSRKLYDLYRQYNSLEELPAKERTTLERDFFRCTLEQCWADTRAFFEQRDPAQIVRAEADSKHKMALVFRSYLGRSSDWANTGIADRKADYQVWCGPAMGAFNEWTKGTPLEKPENRKVSVVAMNLLVGACILTRVNMLRAQGVEVPPGAAGFRPMDSTGLPRFRNTN